MGRVYNMRSYMDQSVDINRAFTNIHEPPAILLSLYTNDVRRDKKSNALPHNSRATRKH